jgi:Hydantoinase/oxoprolinase N-terminal region
MGTDRWRANAGVGGTFTEVTVLDRRTAQVEILKVPTTPADLPAGVLSGMIRPARVINEFTLEDVADFLHGTTVTANPLIQRTFRRCAPRMRRADGQVEDLPVAGSHELAPHDVLTIEGSGSGGYGDPHIRPAELALAGVRADLASTEAADEHYSVVIGERLQIDEPAASIAREESQ